MFSRGAQRVIARRYILSAPLGYGSMGTVYRAFDRLTGDEVAVKLVKPAARASALAATDDDVNLALAREFTVLSTLQHPNIIHVQDYGFCDNGQPYVALELLRDARPIDEAAKGLSVPEKTDLLAQLLQALHYLHRHDILHRDLKPRNVLVTADPHQPDALRVKVLDFGLATLRDQPPTSTLAGTPAYMAPEQLRGEPSTRASDLYAFGVIAYELFAGRRPFNASVMALYRQISEQAPDLGALDAPEHLRYLIAWLLAKEPNSRYTDAGEVLRLMRSGAHFSLTTETPETRESFLQAARFVGRDAELAHLHDELRQAIGGQGRAWLVGGESGVGKSRLMGELCTLASVQGATIVRGRARREGGAPYGVWQDLLRWLCLLSLEPDEIAVLRATVPDSDLLLGTSIKPAQALPPKAEQARLLYTVEAVLRRLESPLLIVLEDLHWDLGESQSLLQHLSGAIADLPVMIVAAYRDDERPDLPSRLPGMHVLHLDRLTSEHTADLAEAMLGPVGRQPALVDWLQQETEGNPLFIVEVVRALAEEAGQLDQIGKRPLPNYVLTGGINGIIHRHLNRVPAYARLFLHAAAVAGRTLDLRVLADVMTRYHVSEPVETLVAACADAAVLIFADNQWHFGHAKLRDGVLRALSNEQARQLHTRIAESIEVVYQYRFKDTAAEQAYHWRAVGNVVLEHRYAFIAGEHALRHGAFERARVYFERAAALLERAPRPPIQQVRLFAYLGDTYLALGAYDRAVDAYETGAKLAREANYLWGESQCLCGLGQAALEQDECPTARTYFLRALSIAQPVRATAVMLQALNGLAALLCITDQTVTAAEYAALVLSHPMTDDDTHYGSERLLEQLKHSLPADVFTGAVERGQSLSLRTVVNGILVA